MRVAVRWKGQPEAQLLAWVRNVYGGDFQVTSQYQFHPTRKWRFDTAIPVLRIGFEMDGIIGGRGGGHQRRQGYLRDREKDLAALARGWVVVRVTSQQIDDGTALSYIEQIVMLRRHEIEEQKRAKRILAASG